MKTLKIIALLAFPFFSIAQENEDCLVLYRNYENILDLESEVNGQNYTLQATGATLIKLNGDQWIAKVSDTSKNVRIVISFSNSKRLVRDYECKALPSPDIYFGNVVNGGEVQDLSAALTIQFPPSTCPIPEGEWKIISFNVQIPNDGQVYSVFGNKLSQHIQDILLGKSLPMNFSIIAKVEGSDGIHRMRGATFTLAPSK